MRFAPLALAAASLFAAACATAPKPAPAPAPSIPVETSVPDYSKVEREIIHLVNVERIRNRLDTLVWNPQLDKAAKIQAVEMASERKMAHDLPGAPHPTLKDRV